MFYRLEDQQQRQNIQMQLDIYPERNNKSENISEKFYKCTNDYEKYYTRSIVLGLILVIIVLSNMHYRSRYQVRETFPYQKHNQNLKGQLFGNFSQLYLNWSQANMSQILLLSEKPFYSKQIQVGSILDFGLTKLIDFDKIQKQMFQKLGYQTAYFQFNKALQRQEKQNRNTFFINDQQIQDFLDQLTKNSKQKIKNIEYNLAIQLIKNQNETKFLEAEYYLANKKYGIGNFKQQLPICIYSSGLNSRKEKKQYLHYFSQIQNLNYSNFHIIYVDDFTDDKQFSEIYRNIKNSSLRIKNKIRFVHTFQKLGVLGNMNFWIKKYCRNEDIVLIIDVDDKLIGRQVLKVLNSIYQAPNIWYVYSKFILTSDNQMNYKKGQVSTFLQHQTSQYRISFEWKTSHMKTFRKKLFNSVPFCSFIQYKYQKQLGVIWPSFYQTAYDMFITYSLLQIAGNHRILHIQDYFYLYNFQNDYSKKCDRVRQIYDGYKSNLKTPLKLISQMGKKSSFLKNYQISQQKIKKVEAIYKEKINCQKNYEKNSIQNKRI